MALVMVVIGFSQVFLDMGISNAIIHKQTITHEQLSTLYWVNVLSGVVLFLLIAAVSPLVANFYHQPKLGNLVMLVGTTFLIQPFGQQFMVLFQKDLRFREMAKIDVTTKALSLIVAVLFAYVGYGVYALVYGTLAATVAQTILFLMVGLKEHKPSFIFKWHSIDEFMSFGLYQMGERTINYFNSQIDTILIGKFLGVEVLGVYNVAKQLIMRPAQILNPIVTKVTFPAMAKVQNDTETLRRVYLKTINYLSSVNFSIYAGMIVLAPEIVILLFGQKWLSAVPLVQILSLYGAVRSTGNPIGSLLLAKGRAKLGFYWNLGLFFYVPICIAIASQWGVVAVSWALVGVMVSLVIPNWFFQVRPLCGARFLDYHKQIILPGLIAFISWVGAYAVSGLFFNAICNVLLVGLIGGCLTLMLNKLWNKGFLNEICTAVVG